MHKNVARGFRRFYARVYRRFLGLANGGTQLYIIYILYMFTLTHTCRHHKLAECELDFTRKRVQFLFAYLMGGQMGLIRVHTAHAALGKANNNIVGANRLRFLSVCNTNYTAPLITIRGSD